jgi:hypothetical protein
MVIWEESAVVPAACVDAVSAAASVDAAVSAVAEATEEAEELPEEDPQPASIPAAIVAQSIALISFLFISTTLLFRNAAAFLTYRHSII